MSNIAVSLEKVNKNVGKRNFISGFTLRLLRFRFRLADIRILYEDHTIDTRAALRMIAGNVRLLVGGGL